MTEIDPTTSRRPYRKVDMGAELEDHAGKLEKFGRLEGQLRVFQVIALALAGTLLVMGQRGCANFDDVKIKQEGLRHKIEGLEKDLAEVNNEAAMKSMLQTDKEHGERLIIIEKRLIIIEKRLHLKKR